jgi:hypothetical protein
MFVNTQTSLKENEETFILPDSKHHKEICLIDFAGSEQLKGKIYEMLNTFSLILFVIDWSTYGEKLHNIALYFFFFFYYSY